MALTAPDPDQLEVTLIGPNVGECVLLHFGGSWAIVDSCLDRASQKPAAQTYLESIGVQPSQVHTIACTHWHDDHFKGLGSLLEWCKGARLWMSGALRRKEFVDAIEAWRDWPEGAEPHTSGLSELAKVVDIARQRGVPPQFAHHDQRMWKAEDGAAELWSLSPSPATIMKSFDQIAKLVPADWAQKNALSDSNPNHWAVAMHFRAGQHAILLGSDLEEEGDAQTGWSAVLASQARPTETAGLYKVAHHGSETGHHPGIWATLLSPKPISILTPFTRSNLPRPLDIERLRAASSSVYLTALRLADNKRKGAAAKMTVLKKLRTVDGPLGRLRCRLRVSDPAGSWHVEIDGPGAKL